MRILFLCMEKSANHGWAKYCLHLSNVLSLQQGISVVTGANAGLENHPDSKIHFLLKSNNRSDPKYTTLVQDLVANFKYYIETDIIIAGDEFSIPISYLAARIFGKRLIVNIHGTYSLKGLAGKRRRIFAAAYRYCERICSVSNYTKAQLIRHMPELEDKIHVLPLAAFLSPPDSLPIQKMQEAHFVIVGAVKPRKGVIKAVQAIKILRDKGYELTLKIVGELNQSENYVRELKQYIDQHNLRSHVELCGFLPVEQKDKLVATAISNLLPSQNVDGSFEGFGFVHLEAGRFATPSIGSLDCGNEDAIIDKKTGFLVAQDDLSGLADRMEMLHTNPNLRNRLGLAAQQNCANWTWQDFGECYLGWLD